MNYQQTIEFLYNRLPVFSRIGAAAYKPSLDNTLRLCGQLGNPQRKFKTIHIAGTNGKGSVSHMLAAILQTAGYRTGLYTSPHLKDFRERIRIDGKMISEEHVIGFTKQIIPAIDEIEPSFFEITVAMAFDYFATSQCDVAVIETGLGGRLDSTNVITPELSIITNIGWDHMNILGDTLEKIAAEKAGIIKPSVPVVLGEATSATLPVFENVAALQKAPLTIASKQRQVMGWKWEKHQLILEVAESGKTDHAVYQLDLPGIYQAKNLLTVLAACSSLKEIGWSIDEHSIHHALRQVKKLTGLHGRWDVIGEHPLVVLDVGHNPDGMAEVMKQTELTDHHQLHIIIGMVNDKEIDGVMRLLPKTARYYFTQAGIPRAMDAGLLQQKAAGFALEGERYTDVNHALSAARSHAHKDDLILVCGSVFLVAEVQV